MRNVLYRGLFCALTILVITVLPASAATTNWTGPGNNWFFNGNWDNGTPGPGDDAFVDTPPPSAIATGAATVSSLTIGSAATGEVDVFNAGSLTVSGGTLVVGDAGTGTLVLSDATTTNASSFNPIIGNSSTGTGTMIVQNSATFNAGTKTLIVGNAGTGTLTIENQGTVTAGRLNVGNSSTGVGTVNVNNQGTLQITGNAEVGTDGTGTVNVSNNGGMSVGGFLFIGENANSTGSVIVKGAGASVTVAGNIDVGTAGTATLEVHNGATVSATNAGNGNINIGDAAGSSGTALVEGAGSTLNAGRDLAIGNDFGVAGGDGILTIKNNGTVNVAMFMDVNGTTSTGDKGTLAVDSSYTLNVGTLLTFDGGRLRFLGDGTDFINDVNLQNNPGPDQNGMFADVTAGNTATISGQLSGNGQLVKTGNGTLVLTNLNNSYSGGTDINNGTLVVGNGGFVLASVFGTGDVNLNGDITTRLRTPEGMPLTYVIFGNFNDNSGQLYTQVGGTNTGVDSDAMGVVGSVNLDPANSHLFVHRINNYNPNNGDVVNIIGALGGVNGQFSDAPPNAPAPNDFLGLIQPFAVYNPDTVDLVFGFAASFQSVAKTPNQIATAEALDDALAAGCIVPATNFLGNVPINTLRHAYDLIAPEELASMYEASFAQSFVNSSNLQHRMDDIRWGSTGFCADGFVIQDNHGYTKNDGKSVADKNVVEQTAPPNYRWGGFITGSGELTKTGDESLNDPGAAGYQLNEAGFTMGVDYRVTDHWAIGLSGAYSHTTGNLVDNGRLNTDGGKMGLYTTWGNNGFYVDAAASGGWNQYDTRRSAYLGQETGSTDGAEFNGMVAAGYDWKKGCWTFGPTASFEYTYVEFNSFTESDTSLIPLHFPDQNQEAYRSNLGFRIAHEQVMKPGEGLTVVPELRAAWRHDFGPSAYAIDSNFVGCDDIFTVHGPWIGRDSAVVDLGLTAYCTPGLSAYIFYDGQFGRDNYNNNAISGGFRVAF